MPFRKCAALAAAFYLGVTFGAPVDSVSAGSKHNLYLATCTQRSLIPGCPLIIICPSAATAATFTAVAYYANGQASGVPTEMATVSEIAEPWEGTLRVAKFRTSSFSSNINIGAASLRKGSIAGDAKMGNEDFACFRDGQTAFMAGGGLGVPEVSCTADYWCASISV